MATAGNRGAGRPPGAVVDSSGAMPDAAPDVAVEAAAPVAGAANSDDGEHHSIACGALPAANQGRAAARHSAKVRTCTLDTDVRRALPARRRATASDATAPP